MGEYSDDEKREIDRQLSQMKRNVLGAIGVNGLHLFPGLRERSLALTNALNGVAAEIERLRAEIGYQEAVTQILGGFSPPPPPSVPASGAARKPIAPLRILLTLKPNITPEQRAEVWGRLSGSPGPGYDPMGVPANQAFKFALTYDRHDDAKALLTEWEELPGVEAVGILPQAGSF